MKKPNERQWISYRWYGFDLDGTIADNALHNFGMGDIGKPIKPITNLMKRLHRQGYRVKIVTARLNDVGEDQVSQLKLKRHIWLWCDKHLGFRPEITDRKDGSMECLYDDRARQVIRNKGIDMGELANELAQMLNDVIEHPVSSMKRAFALRKKCQRLGLI